MSETKSLTNDDDQRVIATCTRKNYLDEWRYLWRRIFFLSCHRHTRNIDISNNVEIENSRLQHEQVGPHEQAEAAVTYSIPGMRPDIL